MEKPGRRVDSHAVLQSINGYNTHYLTRKDFWNRDFQTYHKPMVYKVREVDARGGGLFWMLVALLIGGIVAACVH